MSETQSFLVLHEVIYPKLFISLFILVGVSLGICWRKHFPFIYLIVLCVANLIPWPTF